MNKFLDTAGLNTLWAKMKSYVAGVASTLQSTLEDSERTTAASLNDLNGRLADLKNSAMFCESFTITSGDTATLTAKSGVIGVMAFQNGAPVDCGVEISGKTVSLSWAGITPSTSAPIEVKVIESPGDGDGSVELMVSVTWAMLRELRDGGRLIPGMQYRITDYQCTTVQEFTQAMSNKFDIIVVADDASTLNENARAMKHDGDAYFTNCSLSEWVLKYCLDNDTGRFAWAQKEYNNEYILTNGNDGKLTYQGPESHDSLGTVYGWSSEYGEIVYTRNRYPSVGDNVYTDLSSSEETGLRVTLCRQSQPEGKGVVYYMKDERGNECAYDFKNIQYYVDVLPNSSTFGRFGYGAWHYTIDDGNGVDQSVDTCSLDYGHDIIIPEGEYQGGGMMEESSNHFKVMLGQNIVCGSHDITFGSDCYYNVIRSGADITFGSDCYYNHVSGNNITFGSFCRTNTIFCLYYAEFGNFCDSNKLTNYCQYITFGEKVEGFVSSLQLYHLIVENGCSSITLNSSGTSGSSSYFCNYKILQGTSGTISIAGTTSLYRVPAHNIGFNSSGEIKTWIPADSAE